MAGMLAGQQKGPSLEQLLSAPFPSEMTAAPAGGHIAWVQNEKGVRNIFTASPPDYSAKVVTKYAADDGQEITSLSWPPDAAHILYVRGGAANRSGEVPNPVSSPDGAEQSIWMVPLAGGDPKRIAEGHSPAFVPKGNSVVYLYKGQVWTAGLDGNEKPRQLIKARGQADSLRWSPDGSQLALVSNRGDHSFIGIYDPAAKTLRFLDPSLDRDSNPVWSPDGK
ncbi:MAG: PD40 domain-containing protein, partial [Acidobacteriia bacterium]|nr:PD40 domain-containing protein [Terriglobia bacterium]